MKYKIKNWNKFQHFKDRNPPWIKLHKDVINNREIMMLSPEAFRFLVCLWIIAADDEAIQGNLPSSQDIAFRLRITETKCCDLLRQVDIMLISERYQVDAPEERREETKTETETDTPATIKDIIPFKNPHGELGKVKLTIEEYTKLQAKHAPADLQAAIEILDGYIASNNKRYASHYAVLKESGWVWERVRLMQGKPTPTQQAVRPQTIHELKTRLDLLIQAREAGTSKPGDREIIKDLRDKIMRG